MDKRYWKEEQEEAALTTSNSSGVKQAGKLFHDWY
jgi:hypothetical protein